MNFEEYSQQIMAVQIAKWAAIVEKMPPKEPPKIKKTDKFNLNNKNWTGLPQLIAHVELRGLFIEEYRSDTLIFNRQHVECCRFTTQAAFPFILNIQDECQEVKTTEEFIKILESLNE